MIKRQKDKRKDVRIKRIIGDSKNSPLLVALPSLTFILLGESSKKWIFYGQTDCSPLGLDCQQK